MQQTSLFTDEEMGARQAKFEVVEQRMTYRDGEAFLTPVYRKTKAYYVEQARAIWGDKYDYTDSVYLENKKPIIIYCPKHDYHFRVAMAQNHILKPNKTFRPTGCPICAAEKLHKKEYGTDWHKYLKVCAKNNRVGLIHPKPKKHHMTPEERAEQERIKKEKLEAKQREEKAFMAKYGAKSMPEANFIKKLRERYGGQYDTSLVDYQTDSKPVTLICRDHGMFEMSPRTLLRGSHGVKPHGCWLCEGMEPPKPKMTAKEFYRRMATFNKYSGLKFQRKRVVKSNTKIKAVCYKHGEIEHDVQWWLDGKGCEYCNGKVYYPHWKEYAREKHGDKYEYVGEPPTSIDDMIHYICPEHGLQEQRFDVHVRQGCGCPKCANYPNKKTPLERCNEWIAKCIEKYGEGRYDYSRAHEDYVNNDSLVWIRCCIHNKWFQTTPDNNLRTVVGSCPICALVYKESEGEATIRRWLVKHDIWDFKQDEVTIEHHNPRCKRQYLRPDFWLPRYNLFIEYNGEQHYEEVNIFNDDDWTFEDQQIRDQTLSDYCRKHRINLLEIPYWDFKRIDEILTEYFKTGKSIVRSNAEQ